MDNAINDRGDMFAHGYNEASAGELVGAQISEGEFFGYPLQKWLAVLFIDPEGVLSSILFKTESLDQFEELRRTYRLKGESLLGKTIRAHMCKRASRASGNGYFAVEFEVISDGRFAEAITQFRQQHYTPGMIRMLESKQDNDNDENGDGNGKKK